MSQSKKTQSGKTKNQKKERGFWLSLLLVIMVLYGIFAAYFYYIVRVEESSLDRPWS